MVARAPSFRFTAGGVTVTQLGSTPSTVTLKLATISPPFATATSVAADCSTPTVHSRLDSSATITSSGWSGGGATGPLGRRGAAVSPAAGGHGDEARPRASAGDSGSEGRRGNHGRGRGRQPEVGRGCRQRPR